MDLIDTEENEDSSNGLEVQIFSDGEAGAEHTR